MPPGGHACLSAVMPATAACQSLAAMPCWASLASCEYPAHMKAKNTHAHRYVSVHGLTHVHGSMLAHWTACAAHHRPRAATYPLPAGLGKAAPARMGVPCLRVPFAALCLARPHAFCKGDGAVTSAEPQPPLRPVVLGGQRLPCGRSCLPRGAGPLLYTVLSTGRTAKRACEGEGG